MRSIWKGFILGGLAGAGIGFALEQVAASQTDESSNDNGSESRPGRRVAGTREVWKGFVIGAVTGAVIGVASDGAEALRGTLVAAGENVRQAAREQAPRLAHQIADSHAAQAIGQAGVAAAEQASDIAQGIGHTAADAASDLADAGHDAFESATKRLS